MSDRRRGGIRSLLVSSTSLALLLTSVTVGLRVPSLGLLDPFADPALLDYSAGPLGGIAPLSPEFVAQVLGLKLEAPGTTEVGGDRRGSSHGGSPARGALANDDFESATVVTGLPYRGTADTTVAGRQGGEPATCGPVGGTVWYRYTPQRNRALVADTIGSRYATALGVFRGDSLDRLEQVQCDVDPNGNSQAVFVTADGQPFWFQVTGPVGGGQLIFRLNALGSIERVSVSSAGGEADGTSFYPDMSADGRFVAFNSNASTLVPGFGTPCPQNRLPAKAPGVGGIPSSDVQGAYQGVYGATFGGLLGCRSEVFLRDRATHHTLPGSLTSSGRMANDGSYQPSVSGDGRFVAFVSWATDMVEGDTNGMGDIFVRDMAMGRTERVSVSYTGTQAEPCPCRQPRIPYVNMYGSNVPLISDDGRYVAFASEAENLVPGDRNGAIDVFVRDLRARITTRVSISSSGDEAATDGYSVPLSITPDGRFILFLSSAENLVPNDHNGADDVFLRDRRTRRTVLVSVARNGETGNGSSRSDSIPHNALTPDGRFAVFSSDAGNLVAGDTNGTTDLFVRDLVRGVTERISMSSRGEQAVAASRGACSISDDGRFVAFSSTAPNLVPNDTNSAADVFIRDRLTGTTTRLSVSPQGVEANDASGSTSAITSDGRAVLFTSAASNLVANDTNGVQDVFIHERSQDE